MRQLCFYPSNSDVVAAPSLNEGRGFVIACRSQDIHGISSQLPVRETPAKHLGLGGGVHRHPREFQSPSVWVGGVNYRTKLQSRTVSRVSILLLGSRDMKIEGFGCATLIEETIGFRNNDTADGL